MGFLFLNVKIYFCKGEKGPHFVLCQPSKEKQIQKKIKKPVK